MRRSIEHFGRNGPMATYTILASRQSYTAADVRGNADEVVLVHLSHGLDALLKASATASLSAVA